VNYPGFCIASGRAVILIVVSRWLCCLGVDVCLYGAGFVFHCLGVEGNFCV